MSTTAKSAPDGERLAASLGLKLQELEQVLSILAQHVPDRVVWAFGSRARGERVKKFSDLDLAIEGAELGLSAMGRLAEAFDESRLPFKVDVLQVVSIAPDFLARIAMDKVALQTPRQQR